MKLNKLLSMGLLIVSFDATLISTSCHPSNTINLKFKNYEQMLKYSTSSNYYGLISKKPSMNFPKEPGVTTNTLIGKAFSQYVTVGDMMALTIQALYTAWDLLTLSENFQHPTSFTNIQLNIQKLNAQSQKDRWVIDVSWNEHDENNQIVSRWIGYFTKTAPTWGETPNFVSDLNTSEAIDTLDGLIPGFKAYIDAHYPYLEDIDLLYHMFNISPNTFFSTNIVQKDGIYDDIISVIEDLIWPSIFPWQWDLIFPDWKFTS